MKTNHTTSEKVRFNVLVTMYNDDGSDNGGVRLKLKEITLDSIIKAFLSNFNRWLHTNEYSTESCEKTGANKWKVTIKCSGYKFNLVARQDIILKPEWWED